MAFVGGEEKLENDTFAPSVAVCKAMYPFMRDYSVVGVY